MNIILVALGGFLGSIARYYISLKANKRLIGTWTANITGSILLALLFRYYLDNSISEWLWVFLGVGFCGAYTTFSTFGNETIKLILEKRYWLAIAYVLSSLTVSVLFVYLLI
ncbi:fluoride efflux transporter CrcB [Virgibacillus litoralis]|uniref:Fluoride-specific ion channel FluC n=1 Tax=Virgibacillus litoralis TaxID=578221 RepID=A0ABS4HGV5_9BACI|nr:fluoride efflux transporter CrcB [Virgibacillus litoralis]MBP1950152.1 CrcB protein [Virgibacillus litoralis]